MTTNSESITNAENLKIEGDSLDFSFKNGEVLAQEVAKDHQESKQRVRRAANATHAANVGP